MNHKKLLSLAILGLSIALLPGCAGYRLGSMLPDDVKSVYIPTFVNKSKEPLLEVETTSAAVEEFQKDGSLEVTTEEAADSVLKVQLLEFALQPVAYRRDVKTATEEYRLTIFASVSLTRKSDGSVIAQHPRVKGEATFELAGDMSSAKLRAIPTAAQDLAHSIVEKVVESWQ